MTGTLNTFIPDDFEDILGIPVLDGNHVETLVNGDRIFPPMLEAINNARSEICFETFIYWSGQIAHRFADALSAAAKRDVKVCVLLDWWGAQKMDQDLIEQMRKAGAHVRSFNPPHWWQLNRMNYRTHRKILVVDRQLAFTGGVGIADEWRGDARNPQEWHELHYRISGPIVRSFHHAFQEVWTEVLKEPELGEMENPPGSTEDKRNIKAQAFMSSPRQDNLRVYRAFRHAIESAQDSILIMTAYFVPDQETITALIEAAHRNVQLEIMVPGKHIDKQVVRHASKASWGPLLQNGIRFHVYDPTMLHAKMMVVDDEWVSIGSANFDNRSFSLNDEINLNVFDPNVASEHREIFENDKQRCHRLTRQEWKNRGLAVKAKEAFSGLFRQHL